MSLLFNMLSRLVIAFLPRSKRLLISWLQSPSAVILEPPKIKSVIVSIVSPSICHEVMGLDARWFTQSVNIYSYYVPGISFMSKGKEEKGEGRERGNRHSCRNNACLASLDLQFCIFTFKVSLLTLKLLFLHVKYEASGGSSTIQITICVFFPSFDAIIYSELYHWIPLLIYTKKFYLQSVLNSVSPWGPRPCPVPVKFTAT